LDKQGGHFSATWQVEAAGWASLPGDQSLWPQQVELDGKPVAVASQADHPAIWLTPGKHLAEGRLVWDRLPENLPIPHDSGLVALTVEGRPTAPALNEQGDIWLQGLYGTGEEAAADSLELHIFRRIVDGAPFQVVTRLDIEAAGRQREVLLAGGLLADAIPLALSSPLPTRLEADGRLRVLLRPGHWQIELTSRQPQEVKALGLPSAAEPWPSEEIWSFEAHPDIRVVELTGVPSVDPRQTEMPDEWKNLPAYRLASGSQLALQTLKRGDPDAAPDSLNLRRTMWLDFDGGGYTLHDDISGTLSRDWRLDAAPGLRLGKVEIDNEPQLLTVMDTNKATGVELRQGHMRLTADSRGEGAQLAATGWARDFQSVSTVLNLPPGWRLLAATGVDNAPGTWIGQWTLLDWFMVLIAALGTAMLRGWLSGAVAAATLVLLWQEADAPRQIWLHLLASTALLQALPEGRMKWLVKHYRNLAIAALAFIALPFMLGQVRHGLYPQLEWHNDFGAASDSLAPLPLATTQSEEAEPAAEESERNLPASPPVSAPPPVAVEDYARQALQSPAPSRKPAPMKRAMEKTQALAGAAQSAEIDPNALTQTGPGLPTWRWNRVSLSWNGPVLANQELHLLLLPPSLNLLLNLLRVALIPAMAWLVLRDRSHLRWPPTGVQPLALMLLALLCIPQAKADMPSQELLGELKNRLLAPPDCLPDCAQISLLKLKLGADNLVEQLEIHAHANVAVPLPAQQGQWLPDAASVDGAAADTLFRAADGTLWLGIKPGKHDVVLTGPLPSREQVQLALPLPPHRVEVEGGGWRVEGIKENGEPEGQLQLTRALTSTRTAAESTLTARSLPPFLEVRRTLRLGLTWRVSTEVLRISPPDTPIVQEMPLLEGEAVTTPGLPVKDGKLTVNLAAGQSAMQWESTLAQSPTVVLKAPDTTAWTEVWRADISPMWHMDSSGIAVVSHQDSQGHWLPEWRPWPGESASLRLSRPKGAAGPTLTLESSRLQFTPGRRATDASLALSLRSSQGGQHTVKLPVGAVLQTVEIDGASRPIRQQGQAVTLPIRPGVQQLSLSWQQDSGILPLFQPPEVDIGTPSVNHSSHLILGQDRWVLLTGGPVLGPAVLFWGELLVIAMAAFGLGRLNWTPLRMQHWGLLLIGLSQANLGVAACVVAWLFALGWRGRQGENLNNSRFNASQLGLAVLTLLALSSLFYAISIGLLGLPDMQVAGNASSAWDLNWYQDINASTLRL
jgi:hypothetical protein